MTLCVDRTLNSDDWLFCSSSSFSSRFARDIETVDNTLPQILFMFVMCVFSVISTLVVISSTTPLFVAVILPIGIGYYAIQVNILIG